MMSPENKATDVNRVGFEPQTRLVESDFRKPIPVQLHPVMDDTQWEAEKQHLVDLVLPRFQAIGNQLTKALQKDLDGIGKNIRAFLASVPNIHAGTKERKSSLRRALDCLLDSSPKRILASYQEYASWMGRTYVHDFNLVIDHLAERYPRCRGGIYASRLNYADVTQIADVVLVTLKPTITYLEDLQRRYDLLEALHGELLSDLESPEADRIWRASKEAVIDWTRLTTSNCDENQPDAVELSIGDRVTAWYDDDWYSGEISDFDEGEIWIDFDDGDSDAYPSDEVFPEGTDTSWLSELYSGVKSAIETTAQYGTKATMPLVTAPIVALQGISAQTQGQLAREQRVRVFISTATAFSKGWAEWSNAYEQMVEPNLEMMVQLKVDHVRTTLLGLTDIVTANGYKLCELSSSVESQIKSATTVSSKKVKAKKPKTRRDK
jgi:hypothetical protein